MNLGKQAQFLARRYRAAASGAVVVLAIACGRIDSGGSDAGTVPGQGPDPYLGTSNPDTGTGFRPFDAAPTDSAFPDVGTGPVVTCGADSSPDGSTACALPHSDCFDEHTMRYYASATCNEDAGLCEYQIYATHCPQSPTPPDCYQGGCRITMVR